MEKAAYGGRGALLGGTVTTSNLVDRFQRQHSDLRVSLTDRCSLRCTYCMPEFGMTWLKSADTLTVSEILEIVSVFVELGIRTVRLTGGEPLLRRDLAEIVAGISSLTTPDGDPIRVAMTTNAIGLETVIDDLVQSGLARLNISLDTLSPERFFEITKRDRWNDVMRGVEAAHERSKVMKVLWDSIGSELDRVTNPTNSSFWVQPEMT